MQRGVRVLHRYFIMPHVPPSFHKKIHEWWIYYLLRARFYSIRAVLCLFSCSNFHVIHACLLLVVWMLHNSWLHYSHKASSPMMIRWISLKMLVGLCSNQVTPRVIKHVRPSRKPHWAVSSVVSHQLMSCHPWPGCFLFVSVFLFVGFWKTRKLV